MDLSDFDRLAADLTKAGVLAGVRAVKVADETGRELRDEARRLAPTTRLPHYAATLTHEVKVDGVNVVAEVGPDKDINGQANLGAILEYGAPAVGYPPHAHLGPALDRIGPDWVRRIGDIGGDVL